MSVTEPQPAVRKPSVRWYHLTPGHFVLALLGVEVLLWLSERFAWLGWHKGYAVLTGVAAVGLAMVVVLVWFAVALIFRWRFQFSIRSLLVLVVVVALPCSWLAVEMKKAKDQKEAVAAIKGLGGNLYYDYEFDDSGAWISGAEPATPAWLRARLGDDFFALAKNVTFMSGGKITDHETACLESLPDLKELWLILQRSVSDRTLAHLKGTRKLEVLYLTYCPITDAGLSSLNGLRNLKELDLCGTRVTDAGLMHMEGLVTITSLNLNFTAISDAGLQHMEVFSNLESLNLRGTHITDAGLVRLKGLAHLQTLDLAETKVTDAGVAKLQQALPNCKITR
jgi:hypothetical protein